MRIRFESMVCGRCDGTGRVDYSRIHGSICYDCNGSRRALTKNGALAREAYDALINERCTKPAEDVTAGEKVWQTADRPMFGIPPMFRKSGFYTVTDSRADKGHWTLQFTPDPTTGDPRAYGYRAGTRVRVSMPEVEQQIMREIANRYSGAALIASEADEAAYAAQQAARDAAEEAKRLAHLERQAAKNAALQAKRAAKARAEAAPWRAANADIVAWFESRDRDTFEGSMYRHATTIADGGKLSDSDAKWVRAWIARDAERAEKLAAASHFGAVGAKATITATLNARIDMGNSGFGTRYKVVMTEQGTGAKLISWTAADWPWSLDEGETFTFTATIAKHGEYRGERETDVKNVRIKKNAKK